MMADALYLDVAEADAAFRAFAESVEYVPPQYERGDMPVIADDDDEETAEASKASHPFGAWFG